MLSCWTCSLTMFIRSVWGQASRLLVPPYLQLAVLDHHRIPGTSIRKSATSSAYYSTGPFVWWFIIQLITTPVGSKLVALSPPPCPPSSNTPISHHSLSDDRNAASDLSIICVVPGQQRYGRAGNHRRNHIHNPIPHIRNHMYVITYVITCT